MAEAQYAEAEQARFHLSVEHAADGVAFFRPEMQHAFAFAGDGIACGGEVEDGFAIFEGDGVGVVGEEGLEEAGEGVGGDGAS